MSHIPKCKYRIRWYVTDDDLVVGVIIKVVDIYSSKNTINHYLNCQKPMLKEDCKILIEKSNVFKDIFSNIEYEEYEKW